MECSRMSIKEGRERLPDFHFDSYSFHFEFFIFLLCLIKIVYVHYT